MYPFFSSRFSNSHAHLPYTEHSLHDCDYAISFTLSQFDNNNSYKTKCNFVGFVAVGLQPVCGAWTNWNHPPISLLWNTSMAAVDQSLVYKQILRAPNHSTLKCEYTQLWMI